MVETHIWTYGEAHNTYRGVSVDMHIFIYIYICIYVYTYVCIYIYTVSTFWSKVATVDAERLWTSGAVPRPQRGSLPEVSQRWSPRQRAWGRNAKESSKHRSWWNFARIFMCCLLVWFYGISMGFLRDFMEHNRICDRWSDNDYPLVIKSGNWTSKVLMFVLKGKSLNSMFHQVCFGWFLMFLWIWGHVVMIKHESLG